MTGAEAPTSGPCTDCRRIFIVPAGECTNLTHWRDHKCNSLDIQTPHTGVLLGRWEGIPVTDYEWIMRKQLKLRLGRDLFFGDVYCFR